MRLTSPARFGKGATEKVREEPRRCPTSLGKGRRKTCRKVTRQPPTSSYVYASNLAHIPKQLAWATAKRGMAAHTVKAAYSSQECHRCHYVDRANRPDQSTFNCVVCGYRNHADRNAALNLSSRFGDQELATCKSKAEVKALLLKRHEAWKQTLWVGRSPTRRVRRVTHTCIPRAARRDSEGGLWVNRLTGSRKTKGTTACR